MTELTVQEMSMVDGGGHSFWHSLYVGACLALVAGGTVAAGAATGGIGAAPAAMIGAATAYALCN